MCGFSACISLSLEALNDHSCFTCSDEILHDDKAEDASMGFESSLKSSISMLAHRGPDDSSVLISANERVGLAHCRLSINDLSSAGRQPLHSSDNKVHAVVNGEIYDYDCIRLECETIHNYSFQSHSDSELVVALYEIYGAPDFLTHLRGEFSFILYDTRNGAGRMFATRDRYGIKPLMYTRVGSNLLIASEAKAFLPLGWTPRWDVRAIADAGWMFDDRTIFRGVRKVLPGHYLDIREQGGVVRQVKYWDAEYEDKIKPDIRTVDEMIAGVRERLVESVRLRLRADVPVGIYLSGGIDSSAIAGIATELSRKENVKIGSEGTTGVTCFSVAFPETSGYDESGIAERTAAWLGVKTIKKYITEDTLAGNFADTVFHCEHHHFDLNSVAKFALSTLPREHGVKVVLTGEGADEHFAGYAFFASEFLREADNAVSDFPLSQDGNLRMKMFNTVGQEIQELWQRGGARVYDDKPKHAHTAGEGAAAMCDNLLACHPETTLFAAWLQPPELNYECRQTVLGSYPTDIQAKMRSKWHPLHTAMYMWNKSSLPNVLLSCLGDRTEMAHGVEGRTPFLDHHLTEYINRLPPSVKLGYTAPSKDVEVGPIWTNSTMALLSFKEKWILRQAVRPYITDELYKRKKHPFLAPTRWSENGPLHRMFDGLLTQRAVEHLGFVDYAAIQQAMAIAWGEKADPKAFRLLLFCGAWVTLSQRFGVAKADLSDWEGTA